MTKPFIFAASLLLICTTALTGCGKGKSSSTNANKSGSGNGSSNDGSSSDNTPQTPEEQAKALEKSYRDMNDGKTIVAIDFKKLKAVMPQTLGGLNLVTGSLKGEKTEMQGFSQSQASADFSSEDNEKSYDVKFTDIGPMSGMMRQGMLYWMYAKTSRETDSGFERTSKVASYPAYEKWNNEGSDTDITVFVADRFMVEVRARGIPFDTAKAAVASLPFDKLAAMKDEGVSK